MQWLLTAVILAAAAWMVSAVTHQEDKAAQGGRSRLLDRGRLSHSRVGADVRSKLDGWWRAVAVVAARAARATGSALWWALRAAGMAVATVSRSAGAGAVRVWTALRGDVAERRRTRIERRRRSRAARPQRVPFEKSLILTGPENSAVAVAVGVPTFNASARRPSALSRLLAFIQLVFLVVLWGSGAALAIAGAAWAVTRIV